MKKTKSLIFIATLIVLLVGLSVVSADNITDDTTQTLEKQSPQASTDSVDTPIKNVKKEESVTDLYVSDTDGSDDNSGTNTSPYKTIQKALNQTNADSTYNIHIAEGTYKGLGNTNLTVNGNYYINFIGDGINKTIFDGRASFAIDPNPGYVWGSSEVWYPYVNESGDYAMTIKSGNGLVSICNLSINNMYCRGGSNIGSYAYAPVDNYANLVVDGVSFYSNHGGVGSAIRNNDGSTLTVNNSYFLNNSKAGSTGNNGAGIYNNATAEVYNSLFDGNYARWSTLLNDKNLTVVNCTFQNGIAYDGSSTYKYGAGIGANSGEADYYAPGFFLTNTQVLNCTFVNNHDGQCDIYVYQGNLVATGNKFINSTVIWINDNQDSVSFNYTIDGNVFENVQASSITQSLSTGNNTFVVYAPIRNSNLIISNNTFTSSNGTMITVSDGSVINNTICLTDDGIAVALLGNNTLVENNSIYNRITIDGDSNTIRNNRIITSDDYAVYLTGRSMRNNSITDNELISYGFVGDSSVNGTVNNIGRSIIVNNTPTVPEDYIYVSFDSTMTGNGTVRNPTTINDALLRVEDNQTICLIATKNISLSQIDTININTETVNEATTTFTITSLTDNFVFNRESGTKKERIFNISEGYSVTLDNLNFENIETVDGTLGGAVYTESDLSINNCQFKNITATIGGAVYANKDSNIQITNSTFKDIQSADEALYLNNTGTRTLENNTYTNSSIETTTIISSDAVNRKNSINETITVNIENTSISHPDFYDTTLPDNTTYNIYINSKLVDTASGSKFTITPRTPETINLYIIPDFTNKPSNNLTFMVSYDKKLNIQLNTEDVVAFNDTDTYMETVLTDEFGSTVKTGKVSYYNGQTLIDTVDVENGITTCKLPPLTAGLHEIRITYEDTTETYNSNNNTTQVTILDKVYVNPTLTTASIGTRTNPTTISDALSKITNNHTICIINQDNTYYLSESIMINPETVQENVTTFTIEGENITLDGQKKIRIINITGEYDITLKNITFQNANSNLYGGGYVQNHGGSVYSDGNLTLENTQFINNEALDSYGGAVCSRNIVLLNHNYFINNIAIYGGATYSENITVFNDNHFINNMANNTKTSMNDSKTLGGAIWSVHTNISGSNEFINNYARDYGGCIYSYDTRITGDNDFINNSATYYGGTIHSLTSMMINNNTFIKSNAGIGGVILAYQGVAGMDTRHTAWGMINYSELQSNVEKIVSNNYFINCSSENEIFDFKSMTVTLENNTYVNCSIQVNNNNISLNPETVTPVLLNGDVIIDIDSVTLVHPTLYDENILEDLTYNVYINNDIKTTTNTNNATITIDTVGDNYIYATPTFSQAKSNIIYYDIEKDGLKNTFITTQEVITTINNTAEIMVTVKDKNGELVTGEATITIYNQDNEVIGTKTIIDGTTTVTTTKFTQIGENTIWVTYNTTEKYNNQTNTSTVLVKSPDIYTSPSVTTSQSGSKDNPTTLQDAITKVAQNGTIHILEDNKNTYIIEETIKINPTNTKGVNTFKLQSESEDIQLDGASTTRILEISQDYTIEIVNISFMHGNNSAIYNKGNLTINGKSTYQNNQGNPGGAIQSTGNLIINGSHTFTNNTASTSSTGAGGAINSQGNLTINGNNMFIQNKAFGTSAAGNGRGSAISSSGKVTINGTNIFKNGEVYGTAQANGGALYSTGEIIITGSNTFDNNKATSGRKVIGGAIYSRADLTIEGKNNFTNNLASQDAGAIYAGKQLTINGENYFSNNQATNNGGTLYAISNLTITGANIFTNSTATTGGVIFVQGAETTPTLTIDGTTFENTTATNGGAIYTTKNKLSAQITNNNFKDITSTTETIELTTQNTQLLIENNKYTNCTIQNTFTLTSPQEDTTTIANTPITLETQLTLTHPQYYDEDILRDLEYQILVNNENTYNTTETESTYTPTEYGTYAIQAKTTLLNTPSNTVTVNVNKYEITLDPITVATTEAVDIKATITLNDEASDINTGKVYFKVNGKVLRDSTTNKVIYADVADGVATLTDYTVPANWNEDTEIKAAYTGSGEIPEITSQAVNPTITGSDEPEFTVADATAIAGEELTITVTTKNLDAGKVVLKVNGKTVKATDGKLYAKTSGETTTFTYTIPKTLKAGEYAIKAVYTSGTTKLEADAKLMVE